MVKSMFAGVAGLRTHQQKMDVIGNNIANVNTWGYKAYSFNFQDSIYSTSIRSSGGETTAGSYGGRNPSQVGYGSSMSSISFQYTTGAPSPTDNDLDCMIDGTGLFLVGGMVTGTLTADGVKSSGLYLSRVGIFSVDDNGYLVDNQKNYVYGYALDTTSPNINGGTGTGIPEKPESAAVAALKPSKADVTYNEATGEYTISFLNINATSTSGKVDDLVDAWIEVATDETNGVLKEFGISVDKKSKGTADDKGNFPINFGITLTANSPGAAATFPQVVTDYVNGVNNAPGGTITPGQDYVPGVDAEFNENLSPIRIPIDPDTNERYHLQSYSISDTGVIVGIDTQNRPITLGQLALITVENPNGLEKTNGYYFNIGDNAGAVGVETPGGGAGIIKSKFLEMPNVDLANEFSNMITTQRGFQANSKIITVTDEMLQELVNMKR